MYGQYLAPESSGSEETEFLGSVSLVNEIEAIRIFLLDVAKYYKQALKIKDLEAQAETKILLQNRFVELTKVLSTLTRAQSQITDSAIFTVALQRVVDEGLSKLRSRGVPNVEELEVYLVEELELSRSATYGTGLLPSGDTFDAVIAGMDDSVPAVVEEAQAKIFDCASDHLINGANGNGEPH